MNRDALLAQVRAAISEITDALAAIVTSPQTDKMCEDEFLPRDFVFQQVTKANEALKPLYATLAAPPDVRGEVSFQLWQDDMLVATTYGPYEEALSEIRHYAVMYGQDGPVKILESTETTKEITPWPN